MEPENYEGFIIRPATQEDLHKGLVSLHKSFNSEHVQTILSSRFSNSSEFISLVAEDPERSSIVAFISAFIEQKFIRQGGKVCHIEQVLLTDPSNQGLHQKMVVSVMNLAEKNECYKIITSTSEDEVDMFKSSGFSLKDLHMEEIFS
jgi:glucosamine-phosphate N-acetyltransferase